MSDDESAVARLKKIEATLEEVLEENRIFRACIVDNCDAATAERILECARQTTRRRAEINKTSST